MSTTAPTEIDLGALAQSVLDAQTAIYSEAGSALPQAVHDAVSDFRAAIGDQIASGAQVERDAQELRAKRDLIPPAGYERLRQDALGEAQNVANQADRRAADALDRLRGSLIDAAQPRMEQAREHLARQELALAIGDAQGPEVASRALKIASEGSYEAAAALNSPFGRTLLESRGLTGRDLENAVVAVRGAAASAAEKRGLTTREILAAKLIGQVDGMAAARGAAGSYVMNAIDSASRH